MRKITIIVLSFLMFGCAKKEVKIPTLAEKGIQEIQNHSQVWLFFEVKNNDTIAVVNRKNTISTTHWIYNIDKRLPLNKIIPSITDLQDKHANSMHSEKGMHDYFSYSDTISKKLSFLAFDNVTFINDGLSSKQFIETHKNDYLNYNHINLVFHKNKIWIDGAETDKSNFKTVLSAILAIPSEDKKRMLHLNFSQNLLYQDYLFYRTIIRAIATKNIFINHNEFIFNENNV